MNRIKIINQFLLLISRFVTRLLNRVQVTWRIWNLRWEINFKLVFISEYLDGFPHLVLWLWRFPLWFLSLSMQPQNRPFIWLLISQSICFPCDLVLRNSLVEVHGNAYPCKYSLTTFFCYFQWFNEGTFFVSYQFEAIVVPNFKRQVREVILLQD